MEKFWVLNVKKLKCNYQTTDYTCQKVRSSLLQIKKQ